MERVQISVLVDKFETIKSLIDQSLLDISYDYLNDQAIIYDPQTQKIQAIIDFQNDSRYIIDKILQRE